MRALLEALTDALLLVALVGAAIVVGVAGFSWLAMEALGCG